ncbi:MAG TPA: DUF1508 domain-containing protein [Pyrinomonadaceae bacterium]|jgi:uncharacterized protein YegP (UPF0339 family)/CBS domain-containing protein
MQVREVMSENPACCTPDSSLQEVARMMIENDCGCIPVVDNQSNKKPVGTITDRDITIRTVAAAQNPLAMKASDIMSIDIATIQPDSSLEECFRAMEERDIRRILVVDEKGGCCGIVAQADLAQYSPKPARTTEFLREISDSSQSHNMTMSKNLESNKSAVNARSFLPLLFGVGSGAVLAYFIGGRKARHEETSGSTTRQYLDAESEVNKRQHNLQNRFDELKKETRAPITGGVESNPGRFEIKSSANGKFYFNLKSGNGETILSSELYNSRSAVENGIESVKENAADANRFERKLNKNEEPYFVLKAGNGEVIGTSEVFSSETALENAISAVIKNAPTASISNTAS